MPVYIILRVQYKSLVGLFLEDSIIEQKAFFTAKSIVPEGVTSPGELPKTPENTPTLTPTYDVNAVPTPKPTATPLIIPSPTATWPANVDCSVDPCKSDHCFCMKNPNTSYCVYCPKPYCAEFSVSCS
jgi:hypothetical protein